MSAKALRKLVKKTIFANPVFAGRNIALVEVHGIAYAVGLTLAALPAGLPWDMVDGIAGCEAERFLKQWLCIA